MDSRARKRFGYVAGFVIAGLLVYAVIAASGGMRDAVHQLQHSSAGWLAPALAFEIASYALMGVILRVLRGDFNALGWPTTVRVALVSWGLGSLLPAAPAEGMVMSVSELRRRGVDRAHALTMLFVAGWFQLWALVLTAAGAAALVAGVDHRPNPSDRLDLVIAAAVLAALAWSVVTLARRPFVAKLVAQATWWVPRRRKLTRKELGAAGADVHARILDLLGHRVQRYGIGLAAAARWITDAACLWCALLAAHVHVSFGLVVLAYVAGILASWVPLLPGGLGAVEVAVPAVLHHFGVPLGAALAGTLLWRGLSLFLPAIGGVVAYGSLRAQRVRIARPTA